MADNNGNFWDSDSKKKPDDDNRYGTCTSGNDPAFEKFLKSVEEEAHNTDLDTDYIASEMPESTDKESDDVISDEELAKLLGITTEELCGNMETTADSEKVDDSTHIYKENLVSDKSPEPQAEWPRESVKTPDEEIAQRSIKRAKTDEEPEEEEEYDARDYRPVRRRRNYRTGFMGGILYFALVICISAVLASLCWLAANDVLSLNKDNATATITVDENFTIDQVADDLKNAGIINYKPLFKLFAKYSHAESKIKSGTYELNSSLDYRAIVTKLEGASQAQTEVKVTVPEGKTLKQTFQILEDSNICTVEKLTECAANYEFDYDFLDQSDSGDANRLEGFLFPDTYKFYENSEPQDVIEKFLDNFNTRVSDEMRARADEMGYSLRDIINVASMIEMEAASDSERTKISSVIYNRLNSSDSRYLQIDATVQYALGEHKEKLTNEDLKVDSPYNTYLYEGLPPGPIASPGLSSIGAALHPDDTDYYYYALNTEGTHEFFHSYSDFSAFVESDSYGG